jgi:hypothetical protein
MRIAAVALAAALLLPACASTAMPPSPPPAAPEVDGGDEGDSTLSTVLLYLPNRVLDLFDVVRLGVNAGPGFGAQAKATDAAQAMYLSRTSVGVGLQGLRHPPVHAGVEGALGAGPLGEDVTAGLGWYHSSTDVRVEVHPAIVGAHVAVDPVEIVDFLLGLFTVDLRDDDL